MNNKLLNIAKVIGKIWIYIAVIGTTLFQVNRILNELSKNSQLSFFDFIIEFVVSIIVSWFIFNWLFSYQVKLKDKIEERIKNSITHKQFKNFWHISLIISVLLCIYIVTIPTFIPHFICLYKSSRYNTDEGVKEIT